MLRRNARSGRRLRRVGIRVGTHFDLVAAVNGESVEGSAEFVSGFHGTVGTRAAPGWFLSSDLIRFGQGAMTHGGVVLAWFRVVGCC